MTEFVKVKNKNTTAIVTEWKKKKSEWAFFGELIQITWITCKNKCSNNLHVTLDEQLQIYSKCNIITERWNNVAYKMGYWINQRINIFSELIQKIWDCSKI